MDLREIYDLLFGSYNTFQKVVVMLSILSFIGLAWRNPDGANRSLRSAGRTFVNLLVLIFAGVLLGSVIQAVVPKEVVAAALGRGSGLKGILIGAGIGALVPGGPYVLLPIAASLLSVGADTAPIMSAIIAWSTIALSRIPLELAFLSTRIVLLRLLVGLPLPIIGGYLSKLAGSLI